MKTNAFILSTLALLLLSLQACVQDGCKNKNEPTPSAPEIFLPSLTFDHSLDQVKTFEEGRGSKTAYDEAKRILSVTPSSQAKTSLTTIYYYFDQAGKYRYATADLPSFDELNKLAASLKDWSESNDGTATDRFFVKGKDTQMRLYHVASEAQQTPAILVAPFDNALYAWGRIDKLQGEAGMWVPLLSFGSPLDLLRKYEFRMGHTVNTERTNPAKGFYAFNTGNPRYPMIGYWLDETTNTRMGEAALYVNPENRPSPLEVHTFLTKLGYQKTPLTTGNDELIYYNAELKTAAQVDMNKPKDNTKPHAPRIQFYNRDFSAQLPYDKVNIPDLYFKIGDPMATVKEFYKAKSYTITTEPSFAPEVVPKVITDSKDFPYIFLWADSKDPNIYQGMSLIASGPRSILSPFIVSQILSWGFVEKPGQVMPTYIDEGRKLSIQLDTQGMFGSYSMGLSPLGK